MTEYQYGIEIYNPDTEELVVDRGPADVLMDELWDAQYEFKRWSGFGYDCRRIMRREVITTYGPWEEVPDA